MKEVKIFKNNRFTFFFFGEKSDEVQKLNVAENSKKIATLHRINFEHEFTNRSFKKKYKFSPLFPNPLPQVDRGGEER